MTRSWRGRRLGLVLALAALAAGVVHVVLDRHRPQERSHPRGRQPLDVILITIDALRADGLAFYGTRDPQEAAQRRRARSRYRSSGVAQRPEWGHDHDCLMAYDFADESSDIQYTGRILGEDGKAHGRAELKLVKASDEEPEGARKFLLQFTPRGLNPGRYALAVKLQDPKNGKTSENSFPFDVQ